MLLGANPLIQVVPGLMVWTLVAFVIMLFVLKRYAFGPVQKMIDERRDHIRASIDEADNAREEAKQLLEEHRQLIARREEPRPSRSWPRPARSPTTQQEHMRAETEEDRLRRLEETKRQIEQATQQALGEIRERGREACRCSPPRRSRARR